jgi:putative radical SAM enzyme (TIGR03279 family)
VSMGDAMPGLVKAIESGSVAEQAGLRPGDALIAINGHNLQDVIDAQFYAAESDLQFRIERDGLIMALDVHRDFGQALGIEFEHPTFDIDIRRCNNLCPFCFVLQNAPRMRRTLYIKDDDYRYSFLFGHFVTLTNLQEHDWARIAEQHLSPLYVSVHATDLDIRRRCLRNPTSGDILAQLRWLAGHSIQMHTQLVVTPGLNDGEILEKSIRELATLYPSVLSISVVPVGLTKHHKYGHRPHTHTEAIEVIRLVEAWQRDFRAKHGVGFAYLTDEWYLITDRPLPRKRDYDGLSLQENGLGMVRDFVNEWQRLKRTEVRGTLSNSKYKGAVLATATLFAPTLAKAAREFTTRTGVPLQVVAVRNEGLGETITVAGLLMGNDVIAQLAPIVKPADDTIVILPRIMFDHPDGITLDDVSPLTIARALGRPIALADWMGDVIDALTGKNKLVFDPTVPDLDVPIVREGGWAVEKYL